MLRWEDFARKEGKFAATGLKLLFQHGIGLAYLATVDPNGSPRLHPIVVVYADGGLYTFLIPSPKRRDLERNPHYALHAYPAPEKDDEFALRGVVQRIEDAELRNSVIAEAQHEVEEDQYLYEFLMSSALAAEYEYRGHWPPAYSIWTSKNL